MLNEDDHQEVFEEFDNHIVCDIINSNFELILLYMLFLVKEIVLDVLWVDALFGIEKSFALVYNF
jgi:hypothetical protein